MSNDGIARHDVHLYAVVRVKVCNVPGDDDQARIDNAIEAADLHSRFRSIEMAEETRNDPARPFGVEYSEFAEGFDAFLVDHVLATPKPNGTELIESWYEQNGDPMLGEGQREKRAERAERILRELVNQRRACEAALPEVIDSLIREAEALFPADDEECFRPESEANVYRPKG